MANNEIVWFDLAVYGHTAPVPVHIKTLETVLAQATAMTDASDKFDDDHNFYLNAWFDMLVRQRAVMDYETWLISVLIHVAVCSLKGLAEPPVIFN